jgi:GTP-binding protein LepA
MATGIAVEPLEVGIFRPALTPVATLSTGEVGYVATGLKNVKDCRVGDTLTDLEVPAAEPLPGYRPAKPMVFVGLYPVQPNDYGLLRDALDKLNLNDASLAYQPESSAALGFGFRCGFLGLLHMEIVQERLEREYGLSLLATAPSVEYVVLKTDGSELVVDNPAELPPPNEVQEIREPWMNVSVITPDRYLGAIMELATAAEVSPGDGVPPSTGNKQQATSKAGSRRQGGKRWWPWSTGFPSPRSWSISTTS